MKANRTRRRFSPCCVAAAALLMMGSDIMRGLVQEEQEKLFGLLKTPARNAEIHYRDTSDWGEEHTVYTFDYVAKPDIDTIGGVETRIRFYISETQLKVAWTSYEPAGSGDWEYLEKEVYEIPIGANSDKYAHGQ